MFFAYFLASCSPFAKSDFSANESSDFSDASWTVTWPIDDSSPVGNNCPKFFTDNMVQYGGEAALSNPDFKGLPSGAGTEVRAKKGIVDLMTLFPNTQWSIVYAYSEFRGSGEECFFRMGSDDGIKVWLNGEQVVDDHRHGGLVPDLESFHAVLRNGKNRMLVKICQGTGEWGFSAVKSTKKEYEKYLKSKSGLTLAVSADSAYIGEGEGLSFAALAYPAPLEPALIDYSLTDMANSVIASGTVEQSRRVSVELPNDFTGALNLRIKLSGGAIGAGAQKFFLRGDRDTLFAKTATMARGALKNLKPEIKNDPELVDVGAALEFLADRLEGKLHGSLESEDDKLRAVAFAGETIEAAKKGPEALKAMTGYRQMAYRSDLDGSLQPYSLYVPEGYSREKKYSFVVMIHGYGGADYDWGDTLASLMPGDFIILSAFGRGDLYYRTAGEQDVLDVMDRVMKRYSVDPDRVSLMGISMGGMGTWYLGTLYAERFAAIAPFCGRFGTTYLPNLRNVKTLVVHGSADQTVSVSYDRLAVQKLKDLGYDVRYDEIPGGTHSAWTEWTHTHSPSEMLDFFRSARRNHSPSRIDAVVPAARYGGKYWITVDELDTSGPLTQPVSAILARDDYIFPLESESGSFTAERKNSRSIEIVTKRINALSVDLSLAGIDNASSSAVRIDGMQLMVPEGTRTVRLVRDATGKWAIETAQGSAKLPRHDGGGMADLFMRPLVIVYGTKNPSHKSLLESGARSLADWRWTEKIQVGMRAGGPYVVKADTELTDADIKGSNLILFGSPDDNLVSERIASSLAQYRSLNTLGATLGVTIPNPLAEGRLLGYIEPNLADATEASISEFFGYFQLRFRTYYEGTLVGYPAFCPDVFLVADNVFRDAWSGWFDRNWENLQGR